MTSSYTYGIVGSIGIELIYFRAFTLFCCSFSTAVSPPVASYLVIELALPLFIVDRSCYAPLRVDVVDIEVWAAIRILRSLPTFDRPSHAEMRPRVGVAVHDVEVLVTRVFNDLLIVHRTSGPHCIHSAGFVVLVPCRCVSIKP